MSKKWRKKLILVAKISRVHTQMRCRPDNTSSSLFSVCNKRERERDRPISRKEMGAKNWHEGRETVSSHFLLPVVVYCLLANSKLLAGLCWNADMVGRGVCVCVYLVSSELGPPTGKFFARNSFVFGFFLARVTTSENGTGIFLTQDCTWHDEIIMANILYIHKR